MRDAEAIAAARRELEREGFVVLAAPPTIRSAAVPDWFRPDLAAVRDEQVVVVEVKSTHVPHSAAQIAAARQVAESHGWEFRLWQFDPDEVELPLREVAGESHVVRPEHARRWPREPRHATVQFIGHCAGVEAVLRAILQEDKERDRAGERRVIMRWGLETGPGDTEEMPPVSVESWASLLRNLAVHGFVEPDEYGLLREALAARDAWVHGLDPNALTRLPEEDLHQLGQLPDRLLRRADDIWRRSDLE